MSTKAELEDELKRLKGQVDSTSFNPKKHKDETRSKIALFVVQGYFWIMAGIIFLSPVYNLFIGYVKGDLSLIISIKDLISTVSGATSGIFGFVVGYYFKGSEEE